MLTKITLGALGAALALAATPAAAATYSFEYSGANLFGPLPLTTANFTVTTEDTLNVLGGYFITSIEGDVDGDVITGLLPLEGPSMCTCFPEGFATLGGFLAVGNTIYTDGGAWLDFGGIGFQSATSYYNVYHTGGAGYDMLAIPKTATIDPDAFDLPDGSSYSNGSLAAVPEPGTWALMILGFGAAGATLRRSRAATLGA